ncbi:hypothetical protein [Methanolobus psychrotolerans]|uniref:hypothetical protein n=1 Tax=Methanolobus psychrotolerans TaxID=1874706 RepID=UPI000B917E82|nr:hypothetical protein [Methanolobus psychrotolerans]
MNKIMSHLILCLLLCGTLFFSGCLAEQNETENNTIAVLTDIDDYNITSVSARNGLNGELITIDDEETIDQLIEVLDALNLEEIGLGSVSSRTYYSFKFFHDSTEIYNLSIIQEDLLEINGVYYKVNNTPINMTELRGLVNPLDVSVQRKGEGNDSISSLIKVSTYEMTKVSIINGLSRESGTTENITTIKKLLSDLDSYQMEEPEEPFSNGYRYFLYFYNYSGGVSRVYIVDNKSIEIDNVPYEVVNSSLNMTEFEEFINSKSASDNEGLNAEVSGITESLTIEELDSRSSLIIAGTVTGAYPSRWNTPDGQRPDKPDSELNIGTEDMIYTDVGIHVNKYLKSSYDTQEWVIRVEGGTVGEDSIWVEDAPSFEYGENVLLFLNGNIVTGGYQGKFTMINDTAAVRGDGVSVVITEHYDRWTIAEI